MKSLALLAVAAAAIYYYYLQHPGTSAAFIRGSAPAAATPARPQQHYHSPLDAANAHQSAGYFSNEPAERYELTGPRATSSTQLSRPAATDGTP